MISIPVSFLLAALFLGLAVAFLAWRALPLSARWLFVGLFLLMALEATLVGLRFAYGHFAFLALQRSLPVWIAPAVYLAFRALTEPAGAVRRRSLFHGCVALAVTGAMFLPVPVAGFVDGLIAACFAVYSLALIRLWSGGADRFAEAPTGLGALLHKLLLAAIIAMASTLFVDVWIALLFAQARQEDAALTISLASVVFLAGALALVLGTMRWRKAETPRKDPRPKSEEDQTLVDKAGSLLLEQGLFRDPGLTLTRLARRVGVPDRDLSRAVNAVTGLNVSQFVNQVRLEEAARLLAETQEPVGKIQEQVGFLTRSNFYREFQKMHGAAPGAFRKQAQSPG